MRLFLALVCLSIFVYAAIAEVRVEQSSTRAAGGAASRAIDGNADGHWLGQGCTHTNGELSPYWYLDFGERKTVYGVTITNRHDCCSEHLSDFEIAVTMHTHHVPDYFRREVVLYRKNPIDRELSFKFVKPRGGRYLIIRLNRQAEKNRILTLCEVEYFLTRKEVASFTNTGDAIPADIGKGSQSSGASSGNPDRALDGNTSGRYTDNSCTHTRGERSPWWAVEFAKTVKVFGVEITNRADCCHERLNNFQVAVTKAILAGDYTSADAVLFRKSTFDGTKKFRFAQPRWGKSLVIRLVDVGTTNRVLTLCEVVSFFDAKDVAGVTDTGDEYLGKAKQSSEGWGGNPNRAIDGNDSGIYGHNSCTHTTGERKPWWSLDFGKDRKVYGVSITNRKDCCSERLQKLLVAVTKESDPIHYSNADIVARVDHSSQGTRKFKLAKPRIGSKLVIQLLDIGYDRFLTLCEVRVYFKQGDVAGVTDIGDGYIIGIAKQSSEGWAGDPNRAIDGNDSGIYGHGSCTHTNHGDKSPWWSVDYHKKQKFYGVEIANRADCCSERLQQFEVAVTNAANPANFSTDDVVLTVGAVTFQGKKKFKFTKTRSGSKLVIRFKDTGSVRYLTLCEVIPLMTAAEVAGL